MAASYRLTGNYDQPQVDPDKWLADGRPAGSYPTKTLRPGDPIEFRNAEEKKRLLELGVVEEVEESAQSAEDAEREIEARRKELESQAEQAASKSRRKSGS